MLPSEIAADCTSLDGSESVSVTLRRPEGATVVPVAGALRRVVTRSAQTYDGLTLTGDETVWHLPASAFAAGQEPHPDDTIETPTEVWSIASVRREALATRWRCVCRRRP